VFVVYKLVSIVWAFEEKLMKKKKLRMGID